jgi:methylenetetrahydrofolate reductase (NADPH)
MKRISKHINARQFHIEVLTPKQNAEDLDSALEKFDTKYRKVVDAGHIVTIPDNPMGNPHFNALETITELELPVYPQQTIIHVNTFHTKESLDDMLRDCAEKGVEILLVISGDGGERLPRLSPEDVGTRSNAVTSVDLLRYIHGTYPGTFTCGVAFNPYEPPEHEREKMDQKIDAGASFIATQPVLRRDDRVLELKSLGVPLIVGAWMSRKLSLLSDCVGYNLEDRPDYDPVENLKLLASHYEGCGFYLTMLGFKTQFPKLNEIWANAAAERPV